MKKWSEMSKQEKREVFAFGLGVSVTAVAGVALYKFDRKRRTTFKRGMIEVISNEAVTMPGFKITNDNGKPLCTWLFDNPEGARYFMKGLEECACNCEAMIGKNQFNEAIEAATDAIKEAK